VPESAAGAAVVGTAARVHAQKFLKNSASYGAAGAVVRSFSEGSDYISSDYVKALSGALCWLHSLSLRKRPRRRGTGGGACGSFRKPTATAARSFGPSLSLLGARGAALVADEPPRHNRAVEPGGVMRDTPRSRAAPRLAAD